MTGRRAVALTARREVRERLRSRAFRASTAVQLLLVVGVVVLSSVFDDSGPKRYEVGVVGAQARAVGQAAQRSERAYDARLRLRAYRDAAAARAAVAEGEVDAAVAGGRIVARSDGPEALTALLRSASLRGPPPLPVSEVESERDEGTGLAFLGTLLLYAAIVTFGYALASSVVEEKSSRVVELVLATIRPVHLLVGKVVGIGLVGLAQLLLVAGVGVGVALAVGQLDLPASTGATVALVVVCFVLGYAFYASTFAVAGAIVSRQEDIQSTTSPVIILLVVAYFVSLAVIDDPDGTLARVGTFVPVTAPMVVPTRAAQDALPAGELAVSLALLLLGTALLLSLAARIYERAILRYGAPLKLTQALRLVSREAP